jgi:Metallo-beta-lactamase superfamily
VPGTGHVYSGRGQRLAPVRGATLVRGRDRLRVRVGSAELDAIVEAWASSATSRAVSGSSAGGVGAVPPESEGGLLPGLAELGVGPDDVDVVFLTHIHIDHVGWNRGTFPAIWVFGSGTRPC